MSEVTKKESPQYNPRDIEQSVINFWKENNTFEKSITTRSENQPYRFYDGPPFITGLPHYGSLLSSVVKDVMTRFWTQKGKRIDRVRGWDCHGIYVEQKVQDKLWYTSNKDIEAKGIDGFITGCYEFTQDVSDQWDWYVDHIGRWVDFKNAYKTMDNDYMESVLWVFKSLWNKGLVYKGKRVSMYSTLLNTPISNYEVALDNSYADISDPAITVKFPVVWSIVMQKEEGDDFVKTGDGFIETVFAVIKDEQGRYLSMYNAKHDTRQFPGWKVDIGESPEQAVVREVQEEIGVSATIIKKIGSRKSIMKSKIWYCHVYEVTIDGTPVLQEPLKHAALWYAAVTPVEKSEENSLGYEYSIEGSVIADEKEIMRFPSLYVLMSVLHELPSDSANIPMSFLAWTTTPWTIPANIALVVNPELRYIQIFDLNAKQYFVIAENLVHKYYKESIDYVIVNRTRGRELVGVQYKPPFDFYTNKGEQNHQVYAVDYVTDTDGTGIVHTAPEFGEDDFNTWRKYNLFQTEALDLEGKYTAEVPTYQWTYYREANDTIMQDLKNADLLYKKESITHSVAMCPRTNVPLIYKAQDAWFINIQAVKPLLFANNEKVHWVPDHLKNGRFLKSMESAPDRCISRTRYWATPMPVWTSEDGDMIVLGSREEIYELSQTGSKNIEKRVVDWKEVYRDTLTDKELDLHRPYIDSVRWMKKSPMSGEMQKYTRIAEVLDPWLESGSMPYAQVHYPFENKEKFEASFPADYVAEYVWQVRAWFFFMHAIATMFTMPKKLLTNRDGSTELIDDEPVLPLPKEKYNSPAFTNVVCTGVLAGNDGRKMSKSYGNYPDPKETIEWFGGDTIRLYLCASPIVVGGDMNFSEDGLKETYKKFILPLWNSYYFYTTYAAIDQFAPHENMSLRDILANDGVSALGNPLDRWMVMKTMDLVNTVNASLEEYDMQSGANALIRFMDDLTNRYIRRSRRRFWESGVGADMWQDKKEAYTVLYCILAEVCLVAAPFTPFIAEYIFKTLTGKESVHLEYIEPYDTSALDNTLIHDMWLTQTIVSLGLSLRWQKKLRVKQPLPAVLISDAIPQLYQDMIVEELNVKTLIIDKTLAGKVTAVCKPNAKLLGKKLGKEMQWVINEAKSGNFVLQENGHVLVDSKYDLLPEEFVIEYEKGDVPFDVAIDWSLIVALDDTLTDELRLEGDARDMIRYIQEARKTADYNLDDRIMLSIGLPKDWGNASDMSYASDIQALLNQFGELIAGETLATLIDNLDWADQIEIVELEMVGRVEFSIKKS